MKLPAAIFLLMYMSLQGHGQRAVLSTDTTRLMYFGIGNRISVALPGYNCDELVLRSASGDVSGDGCSYMIVPRRIGPDTFFISLKRNPKKTIDMIKVRVLFIPNPQLRLSFGGGGERFDTNGPSVALKDFLVEGVNYEIVEYNVT